MNRNSKDILGVRVDFGYSLESATKEIVNLISGSKAKCYQVSTTNPEFIIEAQNNVDSKKIINDAHLSLPDGVGVLYAKKFTDEISDIKRTWYFPLHAIFIALKIVVMSFIKKDYLEDRISGVSLVEKLCEISEENNLSIFFLGGWPKDILGRSLIGNYNVAEDAASNLKKKYPGMNLVGATSQFSFKKEDDNNTVSYIHKCMQDNNIAHLDIIFVAYGHPNQELWINRVSKRIPSTVSIGVGGTFDYFSGFQSIAPDVFRKTNTEWLYRLFTQPWRVKRIFSAFLYFPLLVYKETLK